MKNSRKEFYQSIINELIDKHGKDHFTYRLLGEKLEVSKQRAKQIVDYYGLDIPRYDYFTSKECADLKKLIQSNKIANYTFKQIYEDRYHKFLPKAFINALVRSSGKNFLSLTNTACYKDYFSKTKTQDKTKRELFTEVQAMFPKRKLNFSSFCSLLDEEKIPFKRKRVNFTTRKNLAARQRNERITLLVGTFLSATSTNPSLYAMGELHTLYEDFAKNSGQTSIEYQLFRANCVLNKTYVARTKPLALLKRLQILGVNLKSLDSKEITEMHNTQYPLFAINPKILNHYVIQNHLGSHK